MNYLGTPTPHPGRGSPASGRGSALWRAPAVQHPDWSQRAVQRTWRTVGTVFVAIGIVNAFLPLLPTTLFLLLGLWAFGKSDPHMRERLLDHPRFGASLRLWTEKRQLTRKSKIAACCGIGLSAAFTAMVVGPKAITWAVMAGLGGLCMYLVSRPEPSPTA